MPTLKYFNTSTQQWEYLALGGKGDKGDTGTSTFVRVHHGSDPDVDRPDALYVEWVGSVAPNNATTEDTWIDIH